MATTVEHIGIKITVDASSVRAETQGSAQAFDQLARRAADAADDASRSIVSMADSTGQARAAQARATEATQLGAAAQREANEARRTATMAQSEFVDALARTEGGTRRLGVSAVQTQAAMRMLPAQITDITTSLASGMPVWMVAIQQGGQIKDSFGGIGPAFSAITGLITPMMVGLTAGAAAVAGLAFAYEAGRAEAAEFNEQQLLTGNQAGVTTGQLMEMSAALATSANTTRGAAADALATVVGTGKIAADSLDTVAAAALAMNRALGKEIGESVDMFVRLADEPAKASAKLNESMHYLSASTYQRIRELEEQGRKEEATALAVQTASGVIIDRMQAIEGQANVLVRAWRMLAADASKAFDTMAGIGRPKSTGELLADAQANLQQRKERNASLGIKGGKATQELEAEAAQLGRRLMREQDSAWASAERSRVEQAGIAASNYLSDIRKRIDKTSEAKKAVDQYKKSIVDAQSAGLKTPDAAAQKKEIAAIEKELGPKATGGGGGKGDAGAGRIAKADLSADVSAIQARYAGLLTTSGNAERLLDAQRTAGLLGERDYYRQKRDFVAANAATQVEALQQENARYASQKATGADKIANDKKIAENVAKMATIQAKASTDIAVSNLQEAASVKRVETAYQDARDAAQQYLATSQNRYSRELEGQGKGKTWRDQNAAANQINDRYQGERDRLGGDLRRNQITREQYEVYLVIVDASNKTALTLDSQYWAEKQKLQQDWTVGASEAFAAYQESAADVAGQTQNVFERGFKGMEDQLVSFATTGKADFKSLADSVIADLVRIQIRSAMTSVMGGSGGAGGGGIGGLLGGVASMFLGDATGMSIGGTYGSATQAGLDALVGSFTAHAKGGVYDSPSLSAYSGGIYDTPQPFMFAKGAGIFGEAGPEAIMPLSRGADGKLGVAVNGAGGGGAASLTFAPSTTLYIDSRSDRGALMAELQPMLAANNAAQMEHLKRIKAVPK